MILLSLLCATNAGKTLCAPFLQDNVNLEGRKPGADRRERLRSGLSSDGKARADGD